jgi:hypothetical protein
MNAFTRNVILIVIVIVVAATLSDSYTTSKCLLTQNLWRAPTVTKSSLYMGLFDKFTAFGSGASKEALDEQWEAQQEILRNRRKPAAERSAYFKNIEKRREEASVKQKELWGWQTKTYSKGEDPINEWKKKRADGSISDLDNQYGDPKKIGGIPLPSASFGVGGEFGVGGKYDNGGRFDLRLPYAEQGYVDDDADIMGKIGAFFGGKKKQTAKDVKSDAPSSKSFTKEPNKNGWPW